MRRLVLLLTLAVAPLGAPASVTAAGTGISITSTGFHPNNVTVPAGDTVTWTNGDAAKHQVVADDGSFSSPILASKQTYAHVFKAGGTFAYHDGLHPALKGKVTVIPPRTVWISTSGFTPSTISILTGQKVTWVNKSNANQQVNADDGTFSSSVLSPDASFSHVFSTPGTYGYHDGLQATLKGSVVVTQPPAGESITFKSNAAVVTYGSSLELSGTVANGATGEKVTIAAHSQPIAAKSIQSVQTVTTGADGSFTATVHPLIHSVYTAATAKTRSDPLAIDVMPRLRLDRISRTRASARLWAARSFVHKVGLLQVWRRRTGLWVSVARVRFTQAIPTMSPTVITRASVRLHVRHGLRLRVRMPFSQTVPGYVSGASNVIRI